MSRDIENGLFIIIYCKRWCKDCALIMVIYGYVMLCNFFVGVDAQPVVNEELLWAVLDTILAVVYSFAPVKLEEYPYGILYSEAGSASAGPPDPVLNLPAALPAEAPPAVLAADPVVDTPVDPAAGPAACVPAYPTVVAPRTVLAADPGAPGVLGLLSEDPVERSHNFWNKFQRRMCNMKNMEDKVAAIRTSMAIGEVPAVQCCLAQAMAGSGS
jgi:hypothetical protein